MQCQVEWQILWQRVSAGFTAAQQQELANRMIGLLGLGKRKGGRLNPQLLRDAWRLLAGLERLDRAQRARLGDELIGKVRREPKNGALAWAIGRFGARMPLYGPLSSVVTPDVAERWLEGLLGIAAPGAEPLAALAADRRPQDDHAGDVGEEMRARVLTRLGEAAVPESVVRAVREHVAVDRVSGSRLMGESLPQGLRLE